MEIIVRTALREELERVNELRREVNRLHCEGRPDIFKPGFGEALQKHVYDRFDAEDSDVLVALADGVIAGFAIVEYISRPESPYNLARNFLHVQEFGVDVAFRRRGIASAMVTHMRREARGRGFDRIELDAWAFNEGALQFYQSVGFAPFRWYFEMETGD